MAAVVTAALAIAKREDGSDAYFYGGTTLPEGLKAGEVERLVELGLVEVYGESDEAKKPRRGRPVKTDD